MTGVPEKGGAVEAPVGWSSISCSFQTLKPSGSASEKGRLDRIKITVHAQDRVERDILVACQMASMSARDTEEKCLVKGSPLTTAAELLVEVC